VRRIAGGESTGLFTDKERFLVGNTSHRSSAVPFELGSLAYE